MHSTTKYIGGHSDVVGGFVATNDDETAEQLKFLQKSLGAVPGPFDAWLVLRGAKTLAVRMQRHCDNARAVAEFLQTHPVAQHVLWPGFEEHPGHDVAAVHLTRGDVVPGVLREPRVEHLLAPGWVEELDDGARVRAVRSIRTASVFTPRSTSQASNGPGTAPSDFCRNRRRSAIVGRSSRRSRRRRPSGRRGTSSSSAGRCPRRGRAGVCRYGVANVLSTTSSAPTSCAAAAAARCRRC